MSQKAIAVFIAVGVQLALAGMAFAGNSSRGKVKDNPAPTQPGGANYCPGSSIPGGGGSGQVPSPFESSNHKVELADGEIYTLIGKIRIIGSATLFEVDLDQHPWLANARRKDSPFYPILSNKFNYRAWAGERVKITVSARGFVPYSGGDYGHGTQYVIGLYPLTEPEEDDQSR